VSALTAALPLRQRFNPSDLFLAVDSFTQTYTLCLTFAALFSQASLAINSVAGPHVDLTLASRSVAPTVAVASADTASKLHAETAESSSGGLAKIGHWVQSRALEAGVMPVETWFTRLSGPKSAAIGTAPGKLRLLFVAEKIGIDTPALTSNHLSDLRIFTSARPIYALTAAKVAGAVAQTLMFDYRIDNDKQSHFGLPLSSVEVKLVDKGSAKTTDDSAKGEVSNINRIRPSRANVKLDCRHWSCGCRWRSSTGCPWQDQRRQYLGIPIGKLVSMIWSLSKHLVRESHAFKVVTAELISSLTNPPRERVL